MQKIPVDNVVDLRVHLIAAHGYNKDTVNIWHGSQLRSQHDRYHADPTAKHMEHRH